MKFAFNSPLIVSFALIVLALATLRPPHCSAVEFPHFLWQIENSTRRVHLISEVIQDDHKIQVEEYLDLNSYKQLIQFKWHQRVKTEAHQEELLVTRRINVLLLNGRGDKRGVLYQYKAYECASFPLDGQKQPEGNSSWKAFELPDRSSSAAEEQASLLLAKSIVSTALDSPYLARIPARINSDSNSNRSEPESEKWISGIAGLWLAAESSSGAKAGRPELELRGLVHWEEHFWRLYRSDGLVVDYHTTSNLEEVRGPKPRRQPMRNFEGPNLMRVRQNTESGERRHTINVFRVELNFSDQLAANLFSLPIGFNCPANPLLSARGLHLDNGHRSQLTQFELVASLERADQSPLVDVRTIELAHARHPMHPGARLTMFASREDRYKAIQDHSLRLEYKLLPVAGSARAPFSQVQCIVGHLQYDQQQPAGDGDVSSRPTRNTNRVRFNANRLQLELSEFHLDFLLGISPPAIIEPSGCEESQPDRPRLLNRFDVSGAESELVFESEVPPEHLDVLTFLTGPLQEVRMRLVRVYQQQLSPSSLAPSAKVRRGSLKLVRVLLMVFTRDRGEKLAEVRLNLMEDQDILSFARRAHLFDLTRCHDLARDSMELVARYPADPALLNHVDEHANTLLERFYGASMDWLGSSGSDGKLAPSASEQAIQKRRLGASLNFLRLPKLELRRAPGGALELHMTILEKASPLDSFEQIIGATFTTTTPDGAGEDEVDFSQPMLTSSLRECARLCQHFECKLFAYHILSHECRVSHLELDDHDVSCERWASREPRECGQQAKREARVKLVQRPQSDVYFEPRHLRARPLNEASLAEVSSYIEHLSYDLQAFASNGARTSAPEDEDFGGDPMTSRQRRQVTPDRVPLFAFDYVDRSGARSEYAPPVMRLLVPSDLSVRHMPLALNFAREGPQLERATRSFSVRNVSIGYQLSALDDKDEHGKSVFHDEYERLFRDNTSNLYYTLRRVDGVSQEDCALLCYNIEQVNQQTSGEQTCVSFSHNPERQCMLLVKTDFKYLAEPNNIRELTGREGARVLELSSPEQLLRDCYWSIVAWRNYRAEFEGPLRLSGETSSGYHATEHIKDEYSGRGLELAWLDALVVAWDGSAEEYLYEQCAQKCLERNRGARAGETCLAFDHCASSTPTEGPLERGRHQRQVCKLLLVKSEGLLTSSEHAHWVRRLRWHLAQVAATGEGESQAECANQTTSCNRYLLSHLYEFNHLPQRQLRVESSRFAGALAKSSETSFDATLDTCALECSLRTPRDCIMFEFCQSIVGEEKSLERNCTLFRRTDEEAQPGGESSGEAEHLEETSAKNEEFTQLTNHNRDCHVYLRREFLSIEQALAKGALDKFGALKAHNDFGRLGVSVIALLVAGVVLFVAYERRRGASRTGARKGVTMMMTEINERLARTS